MSLTNVTINSTGKTYPVDGNHLTNGGVYHSNVAGLLTDVASNVNGSLPFTTVALAASGTLNLTANVPTTVVRTTSDGTIASATINVPASPNDGDTVALSVTGAVTAVSGTISTAALPAVSALSAGQVVKLRYNASASKWFHVA